MVLMNRVEIIQSKGGDTQTLGSHRNMNWDDVVPHFRPELRRYQKDQ